VRDCGVSYWAAHIVGIVERLLGCRQVLKHRADLDLAGRRRVSRISGVDLNLVDAYRNERSREAAPKTVHTETVVIKQLVNSAVSRELLPTNPLKGLKLKKPRLRPQPCWTREEVDRILSASWEPLRSQLTILAEATTQNSAPKGKEVNHGRTEAESHSARFQHNRRRRRDACSAR
jgi:hypothetical protein